MTEKKEASNALARMDLRKPDDIVREARAKLEAVIAKDPPRWWKDYSARYYDRLREPSRLPTILLGTMNVLALGFMAAVLFGPVAVSTWMTAVCLTAMSALSCIVGMRIADGDQPHGWVALRSFFYPVGFFLTLKEWRACSKLRDRIFNRSTIDDAKYDLSNFAPAKFVRQYYEAQVVKARDDLLGRESRMEKSRSEIDELLVSAKKILQELEKRFSVATDSRKQLLLEGISRARTHVERLEHVREKNARAMKKANEFLDRCQALAEGLDGAIGDVELIRKLGVGIAEDEAVIQRAESAVEDMVQELYTRMVGVHNAAASIQLPSVIDGESITSIAAVEDELAAYERLAEQVLALDVEETKPAEADAPQS